jgi:predicted N-formylglutamate amidohydrolase
MVHTNLTIELREGFHDKGRMQLSLLGPEDPPPFLIGNSGASGPVLLICDHAGMEVPKRLEGLGIEAAQLSRHIGWDIGAAAVARDLAYRLSAAVMCGTYSRLVLDLNRAPSDPTLIAEKSDGCTVPANIGLGTEARRQRIREIFQPYHAGIDARLDWIAARHPDPVLIGIHSFTPVMNGHVRPWHVGILWNRDGRLPVPLMDALRAEPGIVVGDNEPYSGRLFNYTLNRHGEARGIRHVSIEIRQDLIEGPEGAAEWAARLHRVLAGIL